MALGFRNLAAVWQNYRDAGARCLIIPSLLDSDDQAELRKAVPGADIYVVRLVAPLAVNHDRIRGREISADSLRWHLQRSQFLHQKLAEQPLEHTTVDTEGRLPDALAREVITRWGILQRR